jgi:type IV secretory pathway VirB10-like protein
MKRCPQCDSSYPDNEKFCELDGAQLVADYSDSDPNLLVPPGNLDPEPGVPGGAAYTGSPAEVVGAGEYQDSREARLRQNWKTLAIVAVAGVAFGMVLFVVYQRITREAPEQSSNESSNEAVTQQQMPLLPSPPAPFASASPSAEPSPSPSAIPSPAAKAEPAPVTLSSSPVSTGADGKTRRGPVTIRLTDGTSVEAEEVWETGEGIWYRRRGVVTLLERNQVKAIEKPSPASAPSATPATSPSASP